MSPRKPHLPSGGDVVSAPPFYPTPEEWAEVERATGLELLDSDRATLRDRGDWYLLNFETDVAPPPLEDALDRLAKIREHARALADLLMHQATPLGWRTCNAIDAALQHALHDQPTGSHPELEKVRRQIFRTHWAAGEAAAHLKAEATTAHPTEAWDRLIGGLAALYGQRFGKVTVRHDFGSKQNPDDKPSPFVAFVGAFQQLMPERYRRGEQSAAALSKQVSNALDRLSVRKTA
jgi:hypothetical protein